MTQRSRPTNQIISSLSKGGKERLTQLERVLESHSHSEIHDIPNMELSAALGRWSGATRVRYQAALTHFWKWGRANGHCDLHPTLLHGKEQAHDDVLSMPQLRTLYNSAGYLKPLERQTYAQMLILTGQRHGDVPSFYMNRLHYGDMHLPTSKNGTPHIVALGQLMGQTTLANSTRR